MADKKLNTGPAENISPEAAEPIATPEQAAASEPQQEQTGPAIPESGDVVVSFDKINELMAEKRQNARAEVEKSEPWCCTIKVDIENSKGQYIEKDKQEATKDGSESTKIQHGI